MSVSDSQRGFDTSPDRDWVPTDVYDWMSKEKSILVLNYTMACPLKCDFCCYSCHSGRASQKMPIDLAFSLVDQAATLGVFSSIAFTGGEPLLFPDEVCAIAERAQSHSLPFTIATACHWADSPESAEALIDRLADLGLSRLNVSHDPAHAEFVRTANVINACNASLRRQVDTYVVGTFADAGESLAGYAPELAGIPGLRLFNKYIAKVGRAASRPITQSTYGLHLGLDDLACYRRIYHDLVVFWDGRTYPCCSTFNRSTPGIQAGNAHFESLKDIWDRVDGSLLLRTMKRKGLGELYRIIEERDPELAAELPRVESSAGPCSLCHAIFGTRSMSDRVKRAFSGYEADKTLKAIDAIEGMLGRSKTTEILAEIVDMAPQDGVSEVSSSNLQFLPMPRIRAKTEGSEANDGE